MEECFRVCPLLERIDIQVEVDAVPYDDLTSKNKEESSSDIKLRFENARAIQRKRFENEDIFFNAQMDAMRINQYCILNKEARAFMKSVYTSLNLSARAHSKNTQNVTMPIRSILASQSQLFSMSV